MTHSDIIYYINEKKNAIAQKGLYGSSVDKQQIDEIFVKTAAQVGDWIFWIQSQK